MTDRDPQFEEVRDDEQRLSDPNAESRDDHPVGTTAGTGAGATIGAVVGSVGGPVGTVVGGAIGGIVGGLSGHGIAKATEPEGDEVSGDHIPDPGRSA